MSTPNVSEIFEWWYGTPMWRDRQGNMWRREGPYNVGDYLGKWDEEKDYFDCFVAPPQIDQFVVIGRMPPNVQYVSFNDPFEGEGEEDGWMDDEVKAFLKPVDEDDVGYDSDYWYDPSDDELDDIEEDDWKYYSEAEDEEDGWAYDSEAEDEEDNHVPEPVGN